MKAQIEKNYKPDFLLIDSRTGITEMGGMAAKVMPDKLVCLFLNNDENIDGISEAIMSVNALNLNIKIFAVLARIPDPTKYDYKEINNNKILKKLNKKDPTSDIKNIYLFHSDATLELSDALRIGGEKSFKSSTILSDYIKLFDDLFRNIEFDPYLRQFLSMFSKFKGIDRPIKSKQLIDIKSAISENNFLKIVREQYLRGNCYKGFTDSIIKKLALKNGNVECPEVFKEEKGDGAWDFYAGSIMDGHFHFCCEPYYLTKSRDKYIEVIQFGWIENATYYLTENCHLFKLFDNFELSGNKKKYRKILENSIINFMSNNKKFKIGILGETAAACEAISCFSSLVSHDSLERKWATKDLAVWLYADPENRALIVDHDVAIKVKSIIDEKYGKSKPINYRLYDTNLKNNKELIFDFVDKIPVGFICPTHDNEWRQDIVRCILETIDKDAWENGASQNSITNDLKVSNILPFKYDQLQYNLLLELSFKEAIKWVKKFEVSSNQGLFPRRPRLSSN